jgi:hypothetical protein
MTPKLHEYSTITKIRAVLLDGYKHFNKGELVECYFVVNGANPKETIVHMTHIPNRGTTMAITVPHKDIPYLIKSLDSEMADILYNPLTK